MLIRVELIREVEGGWSAVCPELPGCASCGDTRDEALANVREAISLYLEPLEVQARWPSRGTHRESLEWHVSRRDMAGP
jgi:predicted RNase H-like HicB family nuclease